jgi:glycosyltransferase involved in cell wall biosynthesis
VVVPVYNAERFLPLLLDSLLAQTLHEVEFILVDDGSTDGSPVLLAEYARRDPRIRLLRQPNGGVSRARNTGIAAALGTYLAFADADDAIAPDFCSALLQRVEAERLDLLFCNGRHFEEDAKCRGKTLFALPKPAGPISGADWIARCAAEGEFLHYVWLQACRTELARRFTFAPDIVHEDVIWTCEILLAAERVGYLDRVLYCYRNNPFSLVNNPSPESQARRIDGYLAVVKTLAAMAVRPGLPDATSAALLNQAAVEAGHVFRLARKLQSLRRQFATYARAADEGLPGIMRATARGMRQRRRAAEVLLLGKLGCMVRAMSG